MWFSCALRRIATVKSITLGFKQLLLPRTPVADAALQTKARIYSAVQLAEDTPWPSSQPNTLSTRIQRLVACTACSLVAFASLRLVNMHSFCHLAATSCVLALSVALKVIVILEEVGIALVRERQTQDSHRILHLVTLGIGHLATVQT